MGPVVVAVRMYSSAPPLLPVLRRRNGLGIGWLGRWLVPIRITARPRIIRCLSLSFGGRRPWVAAGGFRARIVTASPKHQNKGSHNYSANKES